MIKLALIDDGVVDSYLVTKCYAHYKVNNDILDKVICASSNEINHATKCAMIIEKYATNVAFIDIDIFEKEKNKLTNIDKLISGIELAYECGAKLVYFSLGSIYFQDREKLRRCVNRFAALGVIFVSPDSNTNNITYPATFSTVLSVKSHETSQIDSDYFQIIDNDIFFGTDFIANSIHSIWKGNTTERCNSFAAPVIVAHVYNILRKNSTLSITGIRTALRSQSKVATDKNTGCPTKKLDWLYCSILISDMLQVPEDEYIYFRLCSFLQTQFITESTIKKIYSLLDGEDCDSIIVCFSRDLSDIELAFIQSLKKNIAIISPNKKLCRVRTDYLFYRLPIAEEWSVPNIYGDIKCDEPVVKIAVESNQALLIAATIYRYLFSHEYNALVLSDIPSVLFMGGEFIPSQILRGDIDAIRRYLYCINNLGYYDIDIIVFDSMIEGNCLMLESDVSLEITVQKGIAQIRNGVVDVQIPLESIGEYITNLFDKSEG